MFWAEISECHRLLGLYTQNLTFAEVTPQKKWFVSNNAIPLSPLLLLLLLLLSLILPLLPLLLILSYCHFKWELFWKKHRHHAACRQLSWIMIAFQPFSFVLVMKLAEREKGAFLKVSLLIKKYYCFLPSLHVFPEKARLEEQWIGISLSKKFNHPKTLS